MKKILTYILLIFTLTATAVFGACSCNEEEQQQKNYAVTLNKTELSMVIDSVETITAKVDGKSAETFEYSVDNSAVASVDANGRVSARAIGTATVTVKAVNLGITASCDVTVGLGSNLPSLYFEDVSDGVVTLSADNSYTLCPKIRFGGKIYDDATITYTLNDPTLGTFIGNTFVKSGKLGECTVTATASWRGAVATTLTQEFTVKTADNIAFIINNGTFLGSISLYTVNSHAGTLYDTEYDLSIGVTLNGANVATNQQNLVIKSNDSSIASYNRADGKVVSGVNGQTQIVMEYYPDLTDMSKVYTKTITVNITRPVFNDYNNNIEYFSLATDNFPVETIAGAGVKVIDAYQDGRALTVGENNIISGFTSNPFEVKQSNITFYTDDLVGYNVVTNIFGFVVRNTADLYEIPNYANTSVVFAADIDATDIQNGNSKTFPTIHELKGSIDGHGHTVYNLRLQGGTGNIRYDHGNGEKSYYDGGGIVRVFKENSVLRNISFINVRSSVNSNAGAYQAYIGGLKTEHTTGTKMGTVENVYLQTNMLEADDVTPKTKNAAMFAYECFEFTCKNTIFEFPSIEPTAENNYGGAYNSTTNTLGYGMFLDYLSRTSLSSHNLGTWENVYVITKNESGNIMPLGNSTGGTNYTALSSGNIYLGSYNYLVYASNDLLDLEVSNHQTLSYKDYVVKYTDSWGENYDLPNVSMYSSSILYDYAIDGDGKLNITKKDLAPLTADKLKDSDGKTIVDNVFDVQKRGDDGRYIDDYYYIDVPVTDGTTTYSQELSGLKGIGVMRFGSALSRYDDYSGFINQNATIGGFASSYVWDTTAGYPVWANSIQTKVSIKDGGADYVNRVYLEIPAKASVMPTKDITLYYQDQPISATFELASNNGVAILSGNNVTAAKVGSELVKATFNIGGTNYEKFITVTVDVEAGEHDFNDGEIVEFSARSGKFFRRNGNDFTELTIQDIFGSYVSIDKATVDGVKIQVQDKKYPIGYSFEGTETQVKTIGLTSDKTTYNIKANVYSAIITTEEELTLFNIKDEYTLLKGLYVLGQDIDCSGIQGASKKAINRHFDPDTNTKGEYGFAGTFDGLGHTINELYLGFDGSYAKGYGLFGFVLNGAEFRNVSFTNIRCCPATQVEGMARACLFASSVGSSKFTNIYAHYSDDFELKSSETGLFVRLSAAQTMKNVIVNMPSPSGDAVGAGQGYGFANLLYHNGGKDGSSDDINCKDCYAIMRPNSKNGRIAPLSNYKRGDYDGEPVVIYTIAVNDLEGIKDTENFTKDANGRYTGLYVYNTETKTQSTIDDGLVTVSSNFVTIGRVKNIKQYASLALLNTATSGRVGDFVITDSAVTYSPLQQA